MSRDSVQLKEMSELDNAGAHDVDVDAEHNPEVSRRASNAALAVQMRGQRRRDPEAVHAAAAQGVQSPSTQLPHMAQIQRAFGHHDVSHVQAHVGDGSAEAMGAEAYATGNHVAFAQQPDLHTAAHEAAHVVQQRQGVHFKMGVGAAGDEYEREADAVADAVVQGNSAEHLLGEAKDPSAAPEGVVQRKDKKAPVDAKEEDVESDIFSRVALSSQLKLLAKHMYLAVPQLQQAVAGPHNTPAHTGPGVQSIGTIFERIKAEAEHCGSLMTSLGIDATHKTFAKDQVKLVLGAWTRFQPEMNKAASWAKKEGGSQHDLNEIKSQLDGYTSKIGYDASVKLEPDIQNDYKVTDDKAAYSEAVKDHLRGALEAIESVDAGNGQDAKRIKIHIDELAFLSVGHAGEFKAHKKQLNEVIAAIKALEKSHPELKDSLEASLKKLKALK